MLSFRSRQESYFSATQVNLSLGSLGLLATNKMDHGEGPKMELSREALFNVLNFPLNACSSRYFPGGTS